MDIKLVRELVSIMKANRLTEIEICQEGVTIRLKKEGDRVDKEIVAISSPVTVPVTNGPAVPAAEPPPAQAPAAREPGLSEITSPMVGTFYCSPGPDADPFVQVGDRVEPETTVGIIEAMKIMNEIPAGQSGIVREFLVEDHEAVEYGQPLVLLEPAGT
jgi:acetyl-CoA carboxylase biotin carboxyl carrier protein